MIVEYIVYFTGCKYACMQFLKQPGFLLIHVRAALL